MLNFNSVLITSENPSQLVDFYKKILQKDVEWTGGNFHAFQAGVGGLVIGPHDQVKGKNPNPPRMMLNFATDDVEGEFQRIKDLGVTVIAEPYEPMEEAEGWIATFEDPDGNYFQLMTPYK